MQPTLTKATIYARAQRLRRTMTPSETRLWTLLRRRQAGGFKFRREHPFEPYILDFFCAEVRIAVEVDGSAHNTEQAEAYDQRRDSFLERNGVRVLRVPAVELKNRPERVVAWIVSRCEAAAALAPPSLRASRSRHLPICDGEESETLAKPPSPAASPSS